MTYFKLLTDVPAEELQEMQKQFDEGANPMELKKRLARDIITQLYDDKDATEAENHFSQVVQNKELPNDICEYPISLNKFREYLVQLGRTRVNTTSNVHSAININKLLVEIGLAKSHSEAGRFIAQGAVKIDGEKLISNVASVNDNFIIQVGKRRFAKVINTDKEK